MQWLIHTTRMKVQRNFKAVANCETTKCAACKFGKGDLRLNKVIQSRIILQRAKSQEGSSSAWIDGVCRSLYLPGPRYAIPHKRKVRSI